MSTTIRRGPRPGDLGTVLEMHGRLYAEEYGWHEEFESHVARGLTDFAAALGAAKDDPALPEPGWLWVAEEDGEVVGTVALTVEGDRVGHLRWFLVAPHARGGLGRRMLDALMAHARRCDLRHVRLWTVDGLDAAARLYRDLGFRRTEERPGQHFGHDIVEVRYDLDL